MNWYVIQVRSGREHEIADKCRMFIDQKILQECFIPEYVHNKRFKGAWHQVKDVLFKGYVFMITDRVEDLFIELKKIPDLTKMISKKKDIIYPLKDGEIEFLKTFAGNEHVVDMSTGFIEGNRIHIMEGPLKGKEGMIVKIDRHKRLAYISIEIFNDIQTAKIGLEIISKN